MGDFIQLHQTELVSTGISLAVFVLLRFTFVQAIKRIGRSGNINYARTKLVTRYVSFGIFVVFLVALVLIWGVNIREIGLIISSVFAVLGVALFATWSILSNVTAGIILFFYFPFKIGDRVRILDKDFPEEAVILDIQAFNVNLLRDTGELLTYPNNLLLQKGVVVIKKQVTCSEDLEPKN